ncbi:hypothetical protein [Aquimarina brevivitae]|uniref:Uncharacterized protein n=1 Tax=Aquimarina brevivitae TaxID=323412 RepID=A0A4Q7PHJ7_9FLAO|nr:hypothetical protein [Aquimarina brevivitae]RZS99270.1 hypothetical protein EV197_0479 [Aquimarina brevivitae]
MLCLTDIEIELKKRLAYKYVWYRKQNDLWDSYSNFIYQTKYWDALIPQIAKGVSDNQLDKKEFFYYTINRWYNFWSAVAVEFIFSELPQVVPQKNRKDRLVDFALQGIKFDHKTTRFPNRYKHSLNYAKNNPKDLIQWLYTHQSNQQRRHFDNRLFIVVYANNGEHWKLKSEISWLKDIISTYVTKFDDAKLTKLQLQPHKVTYAGLIWAIK